MFIEVHTYKTNIISVSVKYIYIYIDIYYLYALIHDLKHGRFWWLDARAPLSWQRCGRVPWTPGPIAEAVHGWRSIRVGRQTGFRHFTVGFMGFIYIHTWNMLISIYMYCIYVYPSHCNIFLLGVRLMFSIFPGTTTVATTAALTTATTTPLQLQHEQLQLQLHNHNHNNNSSNSNNSNNNNNKRNDATTSTTAGTVTTTTAIPLRDATPHYAPLRHTTVHHQ